MRKLPLAVALVLLAAPSWAQEPVKNPSALIFTVSPDHATLTAYEVDFVRADGTVEQTITVMPTTPDANGEQRVDVNVMPVAFGAYTFVARAVSGVTQSPNSTPSPVWERAPGAPSNPRVQ